MRLHALVYVHALWMMLICLRFHITLALLRTHVLSGLKLISSSETGVAITFL